MTTTIELLHGDITDRIIGIYLEVLNELGHGYLEQICQRGMVIALESAGLEVQQRKSLPVWFRGHQIGDFSADLVVEKVVLVEIKATHRLEAWHEAQLLNYLRASDLEVGLLINFGPKAEFKRRLYTNDRKVRLSSSSGVT
ncbi:MAG: GxxExxY protein [Acidobacteria bacterium]|nr:MAG: GxxExxY protein [Acidobacteriota bacterium]